MTDFQLTREGFFESRSAVSPSDSDSFGFRFSAFGFRPSAFGFRVPLPFFFLFCFFGFPISGSFGFRLSAFWFFGFQLGFVQLSPVGLRLSAFPHCRSVFRFRFLFLALSGVLFLVFLRPPSPLSSSLFSEDFAARQLRFIICAFHFCASTVRSPPFALRSPARIFPLWLSISAMAAVACELPVPFCF